jgi:tetratricopeptide (TPR) repeat protein
LCRALVWLGAALLAEGKTAAAMSYYRRALALGEKTLGPTHPELADALIGIGMTELANGASKRAIAPLERALELRQKDADAVELARARFALARALADSDVTRATTLANQARAVYAQSAAGNARELGEIDRWLHRRP